MTTEQGCKRTILTIPNLLSLVRLGLIAPMVHCCLTGRYAYAAVLLALSGLTDIADGYIARRFDAVSDVGKVLDPVADKLTMAALLWVLLARHEQMLGLLGLLLVRESLLGVTGALCLWRTQQVHGARWHGKAATALVYGTIFLHLLWQDIPAWMSNSCMTVCASMLLFSMASYTMDNIRRILGGRGGS